MADRRIAIVIRVEGAAKAAGDIDLVKNKTKQFSAAQKSLAGNFTTAIIGARLISAAYTNVKRAIDFGIKSAIDFEFSMKKIQAITGTTGAGLSHLEGVIRDLAAVSPRTAAEVADTALAMAKLGLSSTEVADALEGVIGLSVALDENVETVGATLVAVKNTFQKEAKDLMQISDQLFTGFANSALNLERFTTAFSFAGGAAKLAGVEFNELTALMGVLADAGIRSSTIGTQLRSIFLDMSDSTSKFGKATGGLTIKQDGLVAVLNAAKGVIHGAADAKRLFGKRAVSVIDVLTRSIHKYEALNSAILDSDGAVKKASDTLSESMAVALKETTSAWTDFNIELSKLYKPVLIGFLDALSKSLRGLKDALAFVNDGKLFNKIDKFLGYDQAEAKKLAAKRKELEDYNKKLIEAFKKASAAGGGGAISSWDMAISDITDVTAEAMEKEADTAKRAGEELKRLADRFNDLKEDVTLADAKLVPLGMSMKDVAAEARSLSKALFKGGDEKTALGAADFAASIESRFKKGGDKKDKKELMSMQDRYAQVMQQLGKEEFEKQEALNELWIKKNELLDEYNAKLFESSFQFQLMTTAVEAFGSSLNTIAGSAVDALFQDTVDWGNVFKQVLKDVIKQLIATIIKVTIVDALMKAITFGTPIGPKFGPGFASGFNGVVNRPTPMLVGEAGPERVQITPAAKTARGESKGGLTVVIQGDVYGEEKFTKAVNKAMQNLNRNYVGV